MAKGEMLKALSQQSLSHMVVALISVFSFLLVICGKMSGDDAKTIFAFILGYTFKNGYKVTNTILKSKDGDVDG